MKLAITAIGLAAGLGLVSIVPMGGGTYEPQTPPKSEVDVMDLSSYATDKLTTPLRLLFIHHSCGGQLLANRGPNVGESCIYESHPNGGGLRGQLNEAGYTVHEASYDSEIGANTDIFDWPPKFSNEMAKVLRVEHQDKLLPEGVRNDIVAFKSCFPNNNFRERGEAPGNPAGPELTVENAKAAYRALLTEFQKQPDVLFVAVTAPPLSSVKPKEPLWRSVARVVLKKPLVDVTGSGPLAREFNNWLKATNGWLADYPLKNVVVYDYYDALTGYGRSDYLQYATGDQGQDSHPSDQGNSLVAEAFVPFLNAAVRRAGKN